MENSFFNSNEFRSLLLTSGCSPIARLNRLSDILSKWNQQRIAGLSSTAADLSITDIDILKDIIHTETSKLKLKNAEVVSDQILFMLIGAIKLQIQNKSAKPWQLVNQSINSFTKPDKSKNLPLITLCFITLITLFGALTNSSFLHKNSESVDVFNVESRTSANTLSTTTVNNLVIIYNKMKEGNCQLPQAAMLQPQDREAFIAFINAGKVEIGTAANLNNALGYVHCLYPQKLMDKPLQNSDINR
jgi:hypothetical protein